MTLVQQETFTGFPTSGLATAVPNLFFSRLLPEIDSSEELIVSLYFFFAQSLKRRSPRCVMRKELEADAALMKSLARICGRDGAEALSEGLARAIDRGTLLRATGSANGTNEDIYLLNTPRNRKASETIPSLGWVFDQPLPPGDPSITPNIFSLYEQNIGSITPLIADDLKEAEERYPSTWLHDAFREAVELNKRSWRYIERILRRWEAEGRDNEEPERDPERQWLARRYREGKRKPNARS